MLALLGLSPLRWNPFVDLERQRASARARARRRSPASASAISPSGPLSQTSYGERRRVEIAMALAQEPEGAAARRAVRRPVGRRAARRAASCSAGIPRDVTIVMIEHDMDVALDFADRITLLHFGEVIVEGTRAEVVARSAHPGDLPWRLSALALDDIDAFYGDSHVLHGVSFALGEGRLLGLLGRNGAGKSTCMNVAVGLLPPRGGAIEVLRQAGDRTPRPRRSPRSGVALVPQGRRVFRSLTVRENLAVAARKPARRRRRTLDGRARVRDVPAPAASAASSSPASLSGGEQQMLAIGRALMRNPRVLLMDEPSEGLAPQIVAEVMAAPSAGSRTQGLSIVLVEQNIKLVFELADDIVILNTGAVAFQGTPAALKADEAAIAQHLGVF